MVFPGKWVWNAQTLASRVFRGGEFTHGVSFPKKISPGSLVKLFN